MQRPTVARVRVWLVRVLVAVSLLALGLSEPGRALQTTVVARLWPAPRPLATTPPADPWLHSPAPLIAHALGAVDGHLYTNSREAFAASYGRGYRVLEVDLGFTSDDSLVATHGFDRGPYGTLRRSRRPDFATWRTEREVGRYTRLSAADVVQLAATHPDVWLVLDSKDDLGATLARIVATARALGRSEVLDRLVPQLYRERDVAVAAGVYSWRSYILTLYRLHASDAEVVAIADRQRLRVVTMPAARARTPLVAALRARGITVFAHTVNDAAEAAWLAAHGVSGIYTDSLRTFAREARR